MISFNSPSGNPAGKQSTFQWVDDGTQRRWFQKIIELCLFAIAVPAVGFFFFADDPVGMNSGLPWLLVPPVIFAARYGTTWGLLCAVATAATLLYPWPAYLGQQSQLLALAIGTIILSIIVGDAANTWKRNSRQAYAENHYLRHRLKEFSNDYHVLKVSHSQLEEFMAGKRLSLRQAMQQLQPLLSTDSNGLQAGSELMAIFAQFGAVQVAGLYGMRENRRVDPTPIATHGQMPELQLFDPLLKLAIESRNLVSIKLSPHTAEHGQTSLLAVVPIIDSHNHIHGLLAIKDMHFLAFQQENLNVLALMGAYTGDMLSRSRSVGKSRSGWFLAELDNAVRFARTSKVQSSLLCLQLKKFDQADKVAEFLTSNIRSLDSAWQPNSVNGNATVVILLPLISDKQCKAYLMRAVEAVQEEFKLDLHANLEDVRARQIQKRDTRESCMDFINDFTGMGEARNQKGKRKKKRAA